MYPKRIPWLKRPRVLLLLRPHKMYRALKRLKRTTRTPFPHIRNPNSRPPRNILRLLPKHRRETDRVLTSYRPLPILPHISPASMGRWLTIPGTHIQTTRQPHIYPRRRRSLLFHGHMFRLSRQSTSNRCLYQSHVRAHLSRKSLTRTRTSRRGRRSRLRMSHG